MLTYVSIFITAIFVNNIVLSQFLGICPFLGVSKRIDSALGMGAAVTFVMTLSTIVTYLLQTYLLMPLGLDYMQTIVFILVIAALVQLLEIIIKKIAPALYQALGVFLPLIVVNCIILGRAEAFASKNGVLSSAVDGLGMGLGYTFALFLISFVREFLANMAITFYNPFNAEQILFSFGIEALEPFKISLFSSSVGAFFTFACFAALFSIIRKNMKKKEEAK